MKYYAQVFVTVSHFHPGLIFAGKGGAYQRGAIFGTSLHGRLLDSKTNLTKPNIQLLTIRNQLQL
jgi:hypothetical protein